MQTYSVEDRAYQTNGGYFTLDWRAIDLIGADAKDYLNRMTTVNFKNFDSEKWIHGAFLTGKGQVVALGFFHALENGYRFWLPGAFADKALQHIEAFHFAEQFTATINESVKLTAIYNKDLTYVENFEGKGFTQLSPHLFEFLRVQEGYPLLGKDIGENEIILEGNFEKAVARNKGCYPGQEVVERIFTYGSVNKKLVKIETLPFSKDFEGSEIIIEGKPVGRITSVVEDFNDPKKGLGLAYVHKNYWGFYDSIPVQEKGHIRILQPA